MDDKITDLRNEIWELMVGLGPEAIAAIEQQEVLGKVQVMEDELLKISRDLEATRSKMREVKEALHFKLQAAPERAQKAIANYKESSGFKLGLQRSGQVSYEHGY
ncbi:hypothetical protein BHE74_00045572 [Ensete ventricosum]|nr:hypothetical protein GW17_00057023 [Ensete ventricosum]RWW48356.1 hypothetical protein BHE74_00045572 [Ensete ventricosum]